MRQMENNNRFYRVYPHVISNPDISLQAKGLYTLLVSYRNDMNHIWPSDKTLMKMSGIKSKTTIGTLLKELEDHKVIKRRTTANDEKGGKERVIVLLDSIPSCNIIPAYDTEG